MMKIIYTPFFSACVDGYFFRPCGAPFRPFNSGDDTLVIPCVGGSVTNGRLRGSSLKKGGIYIYVSGMSIICREKQYDAYFGNTMSGDSIPKR